MTSIKIRSASDGMFAILVICAFGFLLLPLCVFRTVQGDLSSGNMDSTEVCFLTIAILALCFPTFAILFYASFHYMKHAVISTSGICIKNPIHKDITIQKENLTAFGKVHFAPRDTKLYFCDAPSERIWYFFEE